MQIEQITHLMPLDTLVDENGAALVPHYFITANGDMIALFPDEMFRELWHYHDEFNSVYYEGPLCLGVEFPMTCHWERSCPAQAWQLTLQTLPVSAEEIPF